MSSHLTCFQIVWWLSCHGCLTTALSLVYLFEQLERVGRQKKIPRSSLGYHRISMVLFCWSKVKNKMATKYFNIKYDFSINEARNKCNTSFSCAFDRAIHFLYYFHDSMSYSRPKSQISRSIKQNYYFEQKKIGTCVRPIFHVILTELSISDIILIIQGDLQCQEVNYKVK